ncbi:phasin family protein [Plantactinospora sp. WMMB334]|uniref:phasin family protein n=1 Tax=Plantactinospora sp. WMMB334 TaxID=3404119 RepID=UPI003B959EF9
MQDAWRAYLELALGLTEASKKRAQAAARKLVGSSGATAAQLQTMAEELLSTGMANREALTRMIRVEIDRTLGALGLATGEDVAALTERVGNLERELAAARRTAPGGTGLEPEADGAGKAAVTKAVGKKTVAKKTLAKKAAAPDAPATKAVAKKALAKKTVAKKAAPGKAVVAKKAVPGKTVAERTTTPGGGAA